jgi:hypothetical protein
LKNSESSIIYIKKELKEIGGGFYILKKLKQI